ncbi:MAG TPA: DUF3999 domain-containing protein [Methylophilaceae bacterium]|nr:DUF3999 domain-containing protein [Methylophilaceae bacterium]
MKFHTLFLTLMLTANNALSADFMLNAKGDAPLYQSVLPKEVYLLSRADDLQDLTIINAAGEQVPYALLRYHDLHPQTAVTKDVKPLKVYPIADEQIDNSDGRNSVIKYFENSGGSVALTLEHNQMVKLNRSVYLVDAGKTHPPLQTFTVAWMGQENKLLPIDIEASNDLENWTSAGHAVLLKTSPLDNAEKSDIALDTLIQNTITLDYAVEARYFKISPTNKNSDWLRMTNISAEYDSVRPLSPEILWQNMPLIKRDESNKDNGITNIDFESQGRIAASYLRVQLPENNTITSATVQARNKNDAPWQTITNASLYRMDKAGKAYANPDIALNAATWRYWRLQFNQANGGIGAENPTLSLGWMPQTVVWNARGQAPFYLRVGTGPAIVSAVDVTSLIPDYKVEKVMQLPKASLVASTTNASVASATASNSWASAPDYKTWLLWAGLAFGVLLLAGMAVSLFKVDSKEK